MLLLTLFFCAYTPLLISAPELGHTNYTPETLKNYYPPEISKACLFSAADTLLWNVFVLHACLLSVSTFS